MQTLDVKRGNTTTETLHFVMEECCRCGIPFLMPQYYKKQLLASKDFFYCPNGHAQHYSGPSEADRLKAELERQKQQNDKDLETLHNQLLDTINEKNKVERNLKRLEKGVCPCCNRSFHNLQQHIQNQHPELLGTQEATKKKIASRKRKAIKKNGIAS